MLTGNTKEKAPAVTSHLVDLQAHHVPHCTTSPKPQTPHDLAFVARMLPRPNMKHGDASSTPHNTTLPYIELLVGE
ncbi:hypothetical protein E2C01_060426 [Portunus trituberculatus]|uniref:Uncharacterized protein n=1 Tax=Portunus trituberculatus TaxID=210409 RepID=A0A5B7H8U4_PORTR|nr:hypothetical protein [Portunus trituberculatus]